MQPIFCGHPQGMCPRQAGELGSPACLEGKVHHAAGSLATIEDAILPYLVASDADLVDGKVVGDPTEGALLVLGYKAGLDIEGTRERLPGWRRCRSTRPTS